MSATHCTITIERLDESRYRATCTLLPDCEMTGSSAEAAREAMEAAIEDYVRARSDAHNTDGQV